LRGLAGSDTSRIKSNANPSLRLTGQSVRELVSRLALQRRRRTVDLL
jgi:hypothetical protein